MISDGKIAEPAIYLIVNSKNQVVAFSSVNVPDAVLVREDDDPELFSKMMREGASCLVDPRINHVIALGLKQ